MPSPPHGFEFGSKVEYTTSKSSVRSGESNSSLRPDEFEPMTRLADFLTIYPSSSDPERDCPNNIR